jgi:hypothetical protein
MARLFLTDGTTRDVTPANGHEFTLRELQDYVDGYIEVVRLPRDRYLVCDEDGKNKDKPLNMNATLQAYVQITASIRPDDVLVGDVLIGSATEMGVET